MDPRDAKEERAMKTVIQRSIVGLSISIVTWTMSAPGILYGADQPRQSVGSEAKVSDKELSAFVKAYVDYQKIRSNYTPVLEKTNDTGRKQQIEQEANEKVKQSLDSNGLSAQRYNQIFATVNADPQLRQKVLKQVEQQRRNS
jgi:hypothetical protein